MSEFRFLFVVGVCSEDVVVCDGVGFCWFVGGGVGDGGSGSFVSAGGVRSGLINCAKSVLLRNISKRVR